MKNIQFKFNWGRVVPILILLITAMLLTSSSALAADPLNYCMDSGNTCAANDFGTLIATVTKVYTGVCVDHDANALTPPAVQLDFYVTVTAAVPTRYDIGSILATDGLPVLRDLYETDSCARGYLGDDGDYYQLTTVDDQTSWPYFNTTDNEWYYWDAEDDGVDVCGDLGGRDSANIYFTGTYVGCVDNNNDGQIDLNICLLYDQQANPDCTDLLTATPPGSVAKCECDDITIPVSPTAITLESLQAGSALPSGTLIGIAALLGVALLVGIWLVWRQRMA
jgi:hypothetical protein